MDPTHRIELLLIARNEALWAAWRAQLLLNELHAGGQVSDEESRLLAAQAYRYRLDVKMAWETLPWWQRAWVAVKEWRGGK